MSFLLSAVKFYAVFSGNCSGSGRLRVGYKKWADIYYILHNHFFCLIPMIRCRLIFVQQLIRLHKLYLRTSENHWANIWEGFCVSNFVYIVKEGGVVGPRFCTLQCIFS